MELAWMMPSDTPRICYIESYHLGHSDGSKIGGLTEMFGTCKRLHTLENQLDVSARL